MNQLQVHTVEVPDPGDLIDRIPRPDGLAWVRHGDGMIGWGTAARVELGAGEGRFREAGQALAQLVGTISDEVRCPGTGLVGFMAGTFDERDQGSVLIVPEVVLGRRNGRAWLTTAWTGDAKPAASVPEAQPLSDGSRLRYAGASMPEVQWLEAVDTAIRHLRAGDDLAKVVLARDLVVWSDTPFDARVLARRLKTRFDGCYTFAVDGLVGATPELLVRRQGDHVEAVPLAGSARRDPDPATDARIGAELLASEKNLDEHRQAAQSVVDALADVAEPLTADEEPWLMRLANIQHLATGVRGTLKAPVSVLDLVTRVHPTAAVCGTPRLEAMEWIRRLEGLSRGRYAGPVGWVDADGDGEFGIALRCAEVSASRARLFAGAGIMADSLPESELEETRIKFHAMRSAFGG